MEFGLHCIEHPILIDREHIVGTDAYVVPTCAVIHSLHEDGAKFGLPPAGQEKIVLVYEQAMDGLAIMQDAGIKMSVCASPLAVSAMAG